MVEWYLLSTPFAVLAIVFLFRFVGCAAIIGIDDVTYSSTPTGQPDYPKTILGESGLVSYWRLQEQQSAAPPSPTTDNTPVSGGAGLAKDERGVNDGTYKAIKINLQGQFPDSPNAPGGLTLGAPGLLETGAQSTSLQIDGGYVEVPFDNSLALTSFSMEAILRPEWSDQEIGLYRTVIEFNLFQTQPPKAFGFALYAGPEDQTTRTGPDIWQVWLGDGTGFAPVKRNTNNPLPVVNFNKTNYVAVTFDGSKLNLYFYVLGIELDNGPFNPVRDAAVSNYKPNSDPTTKFLIGMNATPIGSSVPFYHPFKGRIQEVAVYNKALGMDRIISHIGAGLNVA